MQTTPLRWPAETTVAATCDDQPSGRLRTTRLKFHRMTDHHLEGFHRRRNEVVCELVTISTRRPGRSSAQS